MTLRPLPALTLPFALAWSLPAHATDAMLDLPKVSLTVGSANVTCAMGGSDAAVSFGVYQKTLSGLTTAKLDGLTAALASSSGSYGVFAEWKHYIDEMNSAWASTDTVATLLVNGVAVAYAYRYDEGAQVVTFAFRPAAAVPTLQNGDVIRVEIETNSYAECIGSTSADQALAKGMGTWDGAQIFYQY